MWLCFIIPDASRSEVDLSSSLLFSSPWFQITSDLTVRNCLEGHPGHPSVAGCACPCRSIILVLRAFREARHPPHAAVFIYGPASFFYCSTSSSPFPPALVLPPIKLCLPITTDPLASVSHDPPRAGPDYPFDRDLVPEYTSQLFRACFSREEPSTVRVEPLVHDALGVSTIQSLSLEHVGIVRVRTRRDGGAVLYYAHAGLPGREEHIVEKRPGRGGRDGLACEGRRESRIADGG